MFQSFLLRASFVFAVVFSGALATGAEPVSLFHKVNAPVGLVIRSKPGTDGKRLGTLEDGARGTLAGKVSADEKNVVLPVVSKDRQDPDASWVQISAPKAGYVLYRVSGTSPYDYLVPCK